MIEQSRALIDKARRFATLPVDELAQQNVKRLLADMADALEEATKQNSTK